MIGTSYSLTITSVLNFICFFGVYLITSVFHIFLVPPYLLHFGSIMWVKWWGYGKVAPCVLEVTKLETASSLVKARLHTAWFPPARLGVPGSIRCPHSGPCMQRVCFRLNPVNSESRWGHKTILQEIKTKSGHDMACWAMQFLETNHTHTKV